MGAYDGITYSNTKFFEEQLNWTGIHIEPNINVFEKLEKNRPNCKNYNIAISQEEGELDFIKISGAPEMISGLVKTYDPRHEERLKIELNRDGGEKEIVKVKSKTLDKLFMEENIKNINYLSIDVEGAEMSVIKSINFENIFIDVIGFENNYNDTSKPIIGYLKKRKYRLLKIKSYDIFMIHKDSKFIRKDSKFIR